MDSLIPTAGIAVAGFVATNVDDVFVVAAFSADERFDRRAVVLGQYLGKGALVLAR